MPGAMGPRLRRIALEIRAEELAQVGRPAALPAHGKDQPAGREVFAEYRAGSFQAAGVFIVKDSEFADRFWVRIRGADHMAEVTIQAEDAVAFSKALEDLLSELAL